MKHGEASIVSIFQRVVRSATCIDLLVDERVPRSELLPHVVKILGGVDTLYGSIPGQSRHRWLHSTEALHTPIGLSKADNVFSS